MDSRELEALKEEKNRVLSEFVMWGVCCMLSEELVVQLKELDLQAWGGGTCSATYGK